jgi:hypothetical protein
MEMIAAKDSWTQWAYHLLPRGAYDCCHSDGSPRVVGLVGTAMGFATLAKLLTATLLRDLTSRAPGRLSLRITFGFRPECSSLTLHLEPLILFFNHDLLDSLDGRQQRTGQLGNLEISRVVQVLLRHWDRHQHNCG